MTLDTVFDLASITKPVSTATSVMILVDRGKVDVDAPVDAGMGSRRDDWHKLGGRRSKRRKKEGDAGQVQAQGRRGPGERPGPEPIA